MSANEGVDSRIAVVIVSWNTCGLLRRAVDSVYRHSSRDAVRVYVVDNASDDGSAIMVEQCYPAVVVQRNDTNVGFGRACNQGVALGGEPFVLLLNSDAELQADAMAALVADLRAHPEAGASGARLVFPHGGFQASYNDFPRLTADGFALLGLARALFGPQYPSHRDERSRTGREVDWVGGACMMVRCAAFEAVGGFDQDYYMYSEEMDLCRRLWLAGWRVRYCPAAVAVHHSGQSTGQRSSEQPQLLWESRLMYYRKHRGATAQACLRAMIRLAYLGRAVWWAARGMGADGHDKAVWRARCRSALRLAARL